MEAKRQFPPFSYHISSGPTVHTASSKRAFSTNQMILNRHTGIPLRHGGVVLAIEQQRHPTCQRPSFSIATFFSRACPRLCMTEQPRSAVTALLPVSTAAASSAARPAAASVVDQGADRLGKRSDLLPTTAAGGLSRPTACTAMTTATKLPASSAAAPVSRRSLGVRRSRQYSPLNATCDLSIERSLRTGHLMCLVVL